jgi:hypothetical protein
MAWSIDPSLLPGPAASSSVRQTSFAQGDLMQISVVVHGKNAFAGYEQQILHGWTNSGLGG